ncbi:Uncharacterised protein [Mycobacteroides abscessus subsp. abscessus]|nr:Uncharacterised protein [Mycobacteroides abscessus subsp. abscessus]
MTVVGWDHCTSGSDLAAHEFDVDVLACGDEAHLVGDESCSCPSELGRRSVDGVGTVPLVAGAGKACLDVDHGGRVGVGARCVVDIEVLAVGEVDASLRNP